MKKKIACQLAAKFIEAVADLEQLVKVERPYPTIVFQDTVISDKLVVFAAEHSENIGFAPIIIHKDGCVINSYLPDLDDDGLSEKALGAAGVYLAIDFVEKVEAVGGKYVTHRAYPFEFMSDRQTADLMVSKGADIRQVGKEFLRYTAPPEDVCRSFFSDYGWAILLELQRKVALSDIVKEAVQELNKFFASQRMEFDKSLDIAGMLGMVAAVFYGPEGFGAGLKVRPEKFHEYLNRIYRDLKDKAIELNLD